MPYLLHKHLQSSSHMLISALRCIFINIQGVQRRWKVSKYIFGWGGVGGERRGEKERVRDWGGGLKSFSYVYGLCYHAIYC